MITPTAGYKVDPQNPNGVVPVGSSPLATRYGVGGADTTTALDTPVVPINPTPEQLAARTGTPPGTPTNFVSPLDQAQNDYYAGLSKTVDPAAIREQVRQQMQGQIDAVNVLYKNLSDAQVKTNNATNARVRALNVGSGLSGSDFASANAIGAEKVGADALAALEAERSAKVSAVLGNIDTRQQQEVKDATAAAQTNQKDYIEYLKTRQDGARTDLKSLATTGVPLESLSPDQYQQLLKQSGLDEFTFKQIYNQNRNAAHKITYDYKTVGNKLFGYGIDPITNKLSTVETDLPADVPKNYKPQVLDNGTIVFTPDQLDPTKPVKDQIITYNTGVVKTTEGQKNDTASAARLRPVTAAMAALRDPQSGYVDPTAYADMYQTYVEQNPGKGKEFLDNNPVSVYIAPEKRVLFSTTGY